ncbi:prepilin-type N-terminal cleavage/methylation domain-containing protein [Simiduia litorea]
MIRRHQTALVNKRFGAGFTLIELVAVILLIGIIASTVASRAFTTGDAALQTARDDIVAAVNFAQQQAMDTDGAVVLAITSTTVAVSRDSVPLQFGSVSYPLELPSRVSVAPNATLAFNRLGESSPQVFTLSVGTETTTVSVSAAGYAN